MMEMGSALKRSGDDDFAGGSKKFKLDVVTVTLMVPGSCVATVIGKAGANIKQLEQSSGARISFAKHLGHRDRLDDR
eukprot:1188693-Prorocentrum_minimum.AAC.2